MERWTGTTDGRGGLPRPELPFPFETLRDWYVTPFGGRSEDLRPGQVGIHAEALARNTKLVPHQDRVLISLVGQGDPRPLFAKETYEVVPLDGQRPHALERSPQGEAVLPVVPPWDVVRRPHLQPRTGERLLLNGVSARVFGAEPAEVLAHLVRRHLERRNEGNV